MSDSILLGNNLIVLNFLKTCILQFGNIKFKVIHKSKKNICNLLWT